MSCYYYWQNEVYEVTTDDPLAVGDSLQKQGTGFLVTFEGQTRRSSRDVVVQAVGRANEECIDLDRLEWATYTYWSSDMHTLASTLTSAASAWTRRRKWRRVGVVGVPYCSSLLTHPACTDRNFLGTVSQDMEIEGKCHYWWQDNVDVLHVDNPRSVFNLIGTQSGIVNVIFLADTRVDESSAASDLPQNNATLNLSRCVSCDAWVTDSFRLGDIKVRFGDSEGWAEGWATIPSTSCTR
jgi:hypothetical protein